MGGGLMQLVAYGAQDVYLTGNPQITFWKVTYRRYTNFATESIEQTFNGQADFGRRVTCTISRNGDLAYRTYLQVTLPKIQTVPQEPEVGRGGGLAGSPNAARWLDYPGEQIISCVEVEIGGQRIDRQYGDWMHIWNQLTITASQEEGYNKMVGNTTELTYLATCCGKDVETICDTSASVCGTGCVHRNALPTSTLYVPLQFWYCKNPGLAIPLIALQYHEVKIVLEMNYLENMLWAVQATADDTHNHYPSMSGYFKKAEQIYTNTCLVCASLYVDYVFLDTDERRRMAQNPHEYLIEQLQFTGDQSIGSSSNKIQLNFNHPCKELIWVVQPACNVDYCAQFQAFQQQNMLYGAQPFNYTDQLDGLPRSSLNYRVDLGRPGNNGGTFSPQMAGCVGPYCGLAQRPNFNLNPAGVFVAGGNPDVKNETVTTDWGGATASRCIQVDAEVTPAQSTGLADADGTREDGYAGQANDESNLTYRYRGTGADAANAANGGVDCDSCSLANCPALHCSPARAIAAVVTESSRSQNCWGSNPVVCAKLLLNGQDRFSERLGSYFDLVQPFQHHTSTPATGINVYSFALRPEEHQPSGTCNFSRIDNASLQMVVSANTVRAGGMANVRVYATNYNVLRIMSGMGGLAYSN